MRLEPAAFYALVAIGIPSAVVGAYLTGTTGEVHLLLITGLGATTMAVVVWEESETNSEGADDDTDEDHPR